MHDTAIPNYNKPFGGDTDSELPGRNETLGKLMHTVLTRYLRKSPVALLICWWTTAMVAAAGDAVDVLFPVPNGMHADATIKSGDDAEQEKIREALEQVEARLQRLEERLGPSRRIRPTPATSIERRLEDIERRLNQIEQQLRSLRTLEQRVRRLETQR